MAGTDCGATGYGISIFEDIAMIAAFKTGGKP
jgi:hypothetical protein